MEEHKRPADDFKRTFVEELENIILLLIKGGSAIRPRKSSQAPRSSRPARHPAFQNSVQRAWKHNENRPRRAPPYASHKIFDFLPHLSASMWNVKEKTLHFVRRKAHEIQLRHRPLSQLACPQTIFSLKLHRVHLIDIIIFIFNLLLTPYKVHCFFWHWSHPKNHSQIILMVSRPNCHYLGLPQHPCKAIVSDTWETMAVVPAIPPKNNTPPPERGPPAPFWWVCSDNQEMQTLFF